MNEIQVTPWMTQQATKADLSAPLHDCLWQIAQEQATLKRMKDTGEDWNAAQGKVSEKDLRGHLDTICDDNNFKRIDGSGEGRRNPDVVRTGESIKVRIDPAELNKVAPGVTQGQPSQGAYNKAVTGDNGKGVDVNKKNVVDKWIESVPGFPVLADSTKAALIEAQGRDGVDPQKLATLGGSRAFTNLDPAQQQQLLRNYGSKDKAVANAEIDRLTSLPPDNANLSRLALVASPGFYKLSEADQRAVLDRYDKDPQLHAALDKVVSQPNFKDKDDVSQANALDIMRRYTARNKGYVWVATDGRTAVLVDLYDKVLVNPEFKLNERDYLTKGDSKQGKMLDDFAYESRAGRPG